MKTLLLPRRPKSRSSSAPLHPYKPLARPEQIARIVLAHPMADQLARGQRLDRLTVLHHHQPLAHMGDDGEVVADHQEGELAPPAHLFEQVQHLRLHRSIERRGRLVEQQDRRFEDERAGDGYALALAAGELVRVTEAEAVAEADLVQRTLDALF